MRRLLKSSLRASADAEAHFGIILDVDYPTQTTHETSHAALGLFIRPLTRIVKIDRFQIIDV
jgi:hypothetical protein